MAFGLSSAPSCFQKIMASILAGIPGVAIYLDDIVVHGINAVYHDERLQTVLTALAENHLTLNTDKCVFAASVIDYVGFRLSAGGISPFQSNTLSNAYLSQRHQRKLPPSCRVMWKGQSLLHSGLRNNGILWESWRHWLVSGPVNAGTCTCMDVNSC